MLRQITGRKPRSGRAAAVSSQASAKQPVSLAPKVNAPLMNTQA